MQIGSPSKGGWSRLATRGICAASYDGLAVASASRPVTPESPRSLRRAAIVVVASIAFTGSALGARAALCTATAGGRVILASEAVDPDVFLWDSRQRLIDYSAGQWGSTRAIIAHTLLAEPGTQAVVVSCAPAAAHPKYATSDEDAVGVKIMTGPHRGRYGWVLSSDVRPWRNASPQSASAVPKAHS